MEKRGKVKYADPVKGYGYILAEDAQSPADTTFFDLNAANEEIDHLVSGDDVVFEVDQAKNGKQATQVKRA